MDRVTTLHEAFRGLHQTGIGIIDVGSRGGLHPMFKGVTSLVEAVGFEPDVEECNRLNKEASVAAPYRSLRFLPFALGSADGQRTLHLCRSRGTSSIYQPNRPFLNRFPEADRFDVECQLPIDVRSFDGIVGDPALHLPEYVDFLKVDTQGSELDILQGARKTLCSQVVAVEVEVEFARLYGSQPLFRDIDAFLCECGFTLFKLRRVEWVRKTFEHLSQCSAGQLVFGDALYLKDPVISEIPWKPKDSHQAEALVLISTLYDLYDFALEIISMPPISEVVDAERIRHYILHKSRKLNRLWKRVNTFWDVLRLAKSAVRGASLFKRYEEYWGRGDNNFYSRG